MKKTPRVFLIFIALAFWLFIGAFCSVLWAGGDEIEKVNLAVNSATRWGTPRSDLPDGVYDCEDYVMDKQRMLKSRGISSKRYIVLPETRSELHMVLDVNGRILDNRFTWTQKKEDLIKYGYMFITEVED